MTDKTPVNPNLDHYAARIAALHRELGIPDNYATKRELALQPEVAVAALVIAAHNAGGSAVAYSRRRQQPGGKCIPLPPPRA